MGFTLPYTTYLGMGLGRIFIFIIFHYHVPLACILTILTELLPRKRKFKNRRKTFPCMSLLPFHLKTPPPSSALTNSGPWKKDRCFWQVHHAVPWCAGTMHAWSVSKGFAPDGVENLKLRVSRCEFWYALSAILFSDVSMKPISSEGLSYSHSMYV